MRIVYFDEDKEGDKEILKEAKEMIAASEKSGKYLMMAHNQRLDNVSRKAKEILSITPIDGLALLPFSKCDKYPTDIPLLSAKSINLISLSFLNFLILFLYILPPLHCQNVIILQFDKSSLL